MLLSRRAAAAANYSDLYKIMSFTTGGVRLLTSAEIFGGNASGKSNFIKAVQRGSTIITMPVPQHFILPLKPFIFYW